MSGQPRGGREALLVNRVNGGRRGGRRPAKPLNYKGSPVDRRVDKSLFVNQSTTSPSLEGGGVDEGRGRVDLNLHCQSVQASKVFLIVVRLVASHADQGAVDGGHE
jgi:hypothetical protein